MPHYAVGQYSYPAEAAAAIRQLRSEYDSDADVEIGYFSPFPEHDIEDAAFDGKVKSPVRMFTLLGGLTGCLGAFLFTSWMSIDYPLRVSAKPLVSIPAFVIIAFECTILLGALFTLLGMLFFSRVPNVSHNPEFDEGFTSDKFGVSLKTRSGDAETLASRLKELGAEEVEVSYVRK